MKKIAMIAAFALAGVAANAQEQTNYAGSSKFTDNWSVTLQAGAIANFNDMKDWSPVVLVGADKYFTPWLGAGADVRVAFGSGEWHNTNTIVDAVNVNVYGKVNVINLFKFNGTRRFFEPVAYAGIGYSHKFGEFAHPLDPTDPTPAGAGTVFNNYVNFRAGMEFNFNLGKKRNWAVVVNPACVWGGQRNLFLDGTGSFEVTAGVVYHFTTSNGTTTFTKVTPRSQAEIDALNATIAKIQAEKDECCNKASKAQAQVASLQNQVNELKNRKPEVVTVKQNDGMECYVYYAQGKSAISAAQQPNVERIATFLRNNDKAKVAIKGYASPEGSKEFNERLAQKRADAVKNMLVKRYKIDASRIEAQGCGVGNTFSEPDWNRVSICTIEK